MRNNFWVPSYQPELYHHGVKGMKWGKHLFGDVSQQQGGGGGGASEEDLKLFEKLKDLYGDVKARSMFAEIKQKAQSEANGKSFYEQNKDKMHHTVGSQDLDATKRRYTAEGRDRYRKNGKYRNMNLTDVYGKNSKVKDRSGKDGANLFKDIDADDVHDGKNYSTRDFDTSKYHDGRYKTRDKIREKITGKADPDRLKKEYNDYVRDFERHADQTHAWSVGIEEEHIRSQARKRTDKVEQNVYDSSLAGLISKVTKKKKRRY